MTNWASTSDPADCKSLSDAGIIEIVNDLLVSENELVSKQACWAIGNFLGDSRHVRDKLISLQVLPRLLNMFNEAKRKSNVSIMQLICWCMSNLVRCKPCPPSSITDDVTSVIMNAIYEEDEKLLIDTCWTLSYMTDRDFTNTQNDGYDDENNYDQTNYSPEEFDAQVDHRISLLLSQGIGFRLSDLLTSANIDVDIKVPILRVVGNICYGLEEHTQSMLMTGCLSPLVKLLKVSGDEKRNILQKDASWSIMNIAAGSRQQRQMIITNNVVPELLNLISNGVSAARKHAAYALSNLCSGTPDQVSKERKSATFTTAAAPP